MHLTSGVVGVVRVRRSFKSGVLERRRSTQAQLTRSDILRNIDVLDRGVSGVLYRYLREEGESAFLCLVSALVSQPVLWCSVIWRFVLSVTRSGNHLLSCIPHGVFCKKNNNLTKFYGPIGGLT